MKMNLSKQCMVLWNMSLEGRNAQIQVLTPLSAASWTWAAWSVSLNFTLVISKADMIMPFAQMFIVRIWGQSKCFAQSWCWKMLWVKVIDAPGTLWTEISIIRLRLALAVFGEGTQYTPSTSCSQRVCPDVGPLCLWVHNWMVIFLIEVPGLNTENRRKVSGDSTWPVSKYPFTFHL